MSSDLEESTSPSLDFTKLTQISQLKLDVIPVVVQDAKTKDVITCAYANKQALSETLKTGMATFWSTSRNELWVKGKTSGDYLKVEEVRVNCEQNSLLYLVTPQGDAGCHTKRKSCYYRKLAGDKLDFIES